MQNGKHVILCVDDDPDILEFLRIVLDANDYGVITATSAQEGLEVIKSSSPDLMIVDLMMEEIDAGTSLVKEVRALGKQVPIYMLSSTGDQLNALTDYSDLGLAGVLQKPVDGETLLALLRAKLK